MLPARAERAPFIARRGPSGLTGRTREELAASRLEGTARETRSCTVQAVRTADRRAGLEPGRSLGGRRYRREQGLTDEDGGSTQSHPEGSPCCPDQTVHVPALDAAASSKASRSSPIAGSRALPLRGPCQRVARPGIHETALIRALTTVPGCRFRGRASTSRVRMSTLAPGPRRCRGGTRSRWNTPRRRPCDVPLASERGDHDLVAIEVHA